jgi:hypothetical protein
VQQKLSEKMSRRLLPGIFLKKLEIMLLFCNTMAEICFKVTTLLLFNNTVGVPDYMKSVS